MKYPTGKIKTWNLPSPSYLFSNKAESEVEVEVNGAMYF
jgi:hypothetical protein